MRYGIKDIKLLLSKEMWQRTFSIAAKEYKDRFRNIWIIFLAVAFLLITIFVSFYGTSGGDSGWRNYQDTILWMSTNVEYMIPIFAIVLGYGSVISEKESGSLELLLSYPVDRGEVIAGKFLGLWAVLITCITLGLTVGGVVVGLKVSFLFWPDFYLFVLSSILLGGVYLSLAIFISATMESSTSAMSTSIFIYFFFTLIWFFSMYALAESTFGWAVMEDPTVDPPRWYFGLQFFNPLVIWFTLLGLNIQSFEAWALEFGGSQPVSHPTYLDTWIMIFVLIIWIAVPLLLAEYVLKRKEI